MKIYMLEQDKTGDERFFKDHAAIVHWMKRQYDSWERGPDGDYIGKIDGHNEWWWPHEIEVLEAGP